MGKHKISPAKNAKSSPRKALTRDADWARFAKRLARTLAKLEDDQFLIIAERRRTVYVQFAGQGEQGIWAEAVSNWYRAPAERLSRAELHALRAIGWQSPLQRVKPTGEARTPNYYLDAACPVQHDALAEAAMRALRDVYRTPRPASLRYRAFATGGGFGDYAISFRSLGLKQI